VAQRLCCSLQVDIEKTRRLMDWTPPISLDEGLKRVGAMDPRYYKSENDDGG
jgi:UDP-glucose 4-epimerase